MNKEQQVKEQVILSLKKITEITSDSKTALNMLAFLHDVKLGVEE